MRFHEQSFIREPFSLGTVIAGTREDSNKNGSQSHSTFGQPMGIYIKGTSIIIANDQIGAIKLVTKLKGTVKSLENLRNLCRAFSVHCKHQQHNSCIPKEAH